MSYFRSLIKLDLHRLILVIAMFGVLGTFGNSFYTIYKNQRKQLIENTLEANRNYTSEIANSINIVLISALEQLAYSAIMLAPLIQGNNISALTEEVDRLRTQTNIFNSVVTINNEQAIVAMSPNNIIKQGAMLTPQNTGHIISAQGPHVSEPFMAQSGNYLISISYPILSQENNFIGYLSGTIYLWPTSILSSILGEHYYQNGSYLYVVNNQRTILYHPDPKLIGQKVTDNSVVDLVLQGKEGIKIVRNAEGQDILMGFSPIETTNWGVIAQRTSKATLSGLDELMMDTMKGMLPITIFIMGTIWLSATLISRPLRKLAENTSLMGRHDTALDIEQVQAWYFEAFQLKLAILEGLGRLNAKIDKLYVDSNTDPMTGILNRRAMQKFLDHVQIKSLPLAVIALDIDNFKSINDNFGHDVGDAVIISLTTIMQQEIRANNALFRSGGEEFLLLMPDTTLDKAQRIAERLRAKVENHEMEKVGCITISLGIAYWSVNDGSLKETLKQADKALYEAKHQGRNCVVVANS
ncbi:UNVERIFIED_CONTAM: GGDEF domain-containing protein [Aeromonas hydrophila]